MLLVSGELSIVALRNKRLTGTIESLYLTNIINVHNRYSNERRETTLMIQLSEDGIFMYCTMYHGCLQGTMPKGRKWVVSSFNVICTRNVIQISRGDIIIVLNPALFDIVVDIYILSLSDIYMLLNYWCQMYLVSFLNHWFK